MAVGFTFWPMRRLHRILVLAAGIVACGDSIAGPKGPSATSTLVKATVTLSKLVVQRGDTMRFSYSLQNLTANSLTLNTATGCQIRPELDQVGGALMKPPALSNALLCPDVPTVITLTAGQTVTYSILLRGYDPSKAVTAQVPGYLLTTGVFDASVLITATEIVSVRSDWVRFEVK